VLHGSTFLAIVTPSYIYMLQSAVFEGMLIIYERDLSRDNCPHRRDKEAIMELLVEYYLILARFKKGANKQTAF
jgi:hypothetical protein